MLLEFYQLLKTFSEHLKMYLFT